MMQCSGSTGMRRAAQLSTGVQRGSQSQPRTHRRALSAARPWRASEPVHALGLDLEALDIPDIDGDLKTVKLELGAVMDDAGVAQTFGTSAQALEALQHGVVLLDRSHWGRLRITGEGRMSFLHNQSTNDFMRLRPGQGCDTVFTTATARTLDLATALINESSVLLLVSPEMREPLAARFDKYIFPADKVQVQDVSARCAMLTLMGPEASAVLQEVAGDALTVLNQPHGRHELVGFRGAPLVVLCGTGLPHPGYTLIVDESLGGELFGLLATKGCVLMGEQEWEVARVQAGRPAVGSELTEDVNPLEAGLHYAVSLNKGCYIGQETLSKVHGLDGVKQQLWALQLHAAVSAGTAVLDGSGQALGKVTSVVCSPGGQHWAVAYLKRKVKGAAVQLEGMSVDVGGVPAIVRAAPFVTNILADQLPEEASGPGADRKLEAVMAQRLAAQEAAAAAAKAKAEKLAAMQARLAAWQAAQTPAHRRASPPSPDQTPTPSSAASASSTAV